MTWLKEANDLIRGSSKCQQTPSISNHDGKTKKPMVTCWPKYLPGSTQLLNWGELRLAGMQREGSLSTECRNVNWSNLLKKKSSKSWRHRSTTGSTIKCNNPHLGVYNQRAWSGHVDEISVLLCPSQHHSQQSILLSINLNPQV